MKTAIDIVIETLTALKDEALNESKISRIKNEGNPVADAIYMAYSIAIKEAKKLKETEKHQIINSYRDGYLSDDIKLSSEYYKDKFENNI